MKETPRTDSISRNNHTVKLADYHSALRIWGVKHFRYFPWRLRKEPYELLIAEIMLHRTRVQQVLPVYESFLDTYPDVPSLAKASKEELHCALSSLGLRSRVNMLYAMAQILVRDFDCQVPGDRDQLQSLPGISHYIAGAVRCFSLHIPEPLVDTNTVRIISRVFGIPVTDSLRRNKTFTELVTLLVDPLHPGAYNYALLDLAHLVCTVKLPNCPGCPIKDYCLYAADRKRDRDQAD